MLKSDFVGAKCTLYRVVKEDLFEAKIIKLRNEHWEANNEKAKKDHSRCWKYFVQRPWGKEQKQE